MTSQRNFSQNLGKSWRLTCLINIYVQVTVLKWRVLNKVNSNDQFSALSLNLGLGSRIAKGRSQSRKLLILEEELCCLRRVNKLAIKRSSGRQRPSKEANYTRSVHINCSIWLRSQRLWRAQLVPLNTFIWRM